MKIISKYRVDNLDAGPKAKVDIENILKNEYNCEICALKLGPKETEDRFVRKMCRKIQKVFFELKNFKKNDIIIVQSPFTSRNFVTDACKNKIAIVHDINGLRTGNAAELKKEIDFLKTCKAVIAHNQYMERFLSENGVSCKIVDIGVFDYLLGEDAEKHTAQPLSGEPVVVYAGNLAKSPFLYQLEEEKMRFRMNVYGVGTDKDINGKINYKGKYRPDELPNKLEGNLGLVWDGNFDESDENEGFKNYTKYNNPHKLSCYIAAGLPVIVWEKAAVADFVSENGIGYTVSSVYDINALDLSDYDVKRKNTLELSACVRNGVFTKKAIEKVFSLI